jgi:hypothetical protein
MSSKSTKTFRFKGEDDGQPLTTSQRNLLKELETGEEAPEGPYVDPEGGRNAEIRKDAEAWALSEPIQALKDGLGELLPKEVRAAAAQLLDAPGQEAQLAAAIAALTEAKNDGKEADGRQVDGRAEGGQERSPTDDAGPGSPTSRLSPVDWARPRELLDDPTGPGPDSPSDVRVEGDGSEGPPIDAQGSEPFGEGVDAGDRTLPE